MPGAQTSLYDERVDERRRWPLAVATFPVWTIQQPSRSPVRRRHYIPVRRRALSAAAALWGTLPPAVFGLQLICHMISFRTPAVCLAAILLPSMAAAQSESPCESYSQSGAVFVGTAGAVVKRIVQLPNHPPIEMKLTPVEVEQAYLGVTTPVMYITPLGVETYAAPGQKYLVYGRSYHPPDIVMASPGNNMKEIEKAGEDLAFLQALTPGSTGGTIGGTVEQKDLVYGGTFNLRGPLTGIPVRIFNETHATDAVTDAQGRFSASGIPAGVYELTPQFPEGLVVLDSTSRIHAIVRDSGCASVKIEAVFNGRVRGVLRGPDGRPLALTSVDLMPMDVQQEPHTGDIAGTGSVSTNDNGEFEFAGRPAGRYYLGVSLYNAPNPNGPSYPRTYYPGTTDRATAIPVIVEQGRAGETFDFSVPAVLPKGELVYVVETQYSGALKVCFVELENLFSRRTSYDVKPGVKYRLPVVDGQRYQVHVHLNFRGGHLESEPFVFTATTGEATVTLRPDAPRELHR